MTEGQLSHIRNEYIVASMDADEAEDACRKRLALIGERLVTLGRAFIDRPEEVNPVPEPISSYDYRKEIAILRDGEAAIKLSADLRQLIQQAKAMRQRLESFKSGPFSSPASES
jgi:hypothetical protein